MDSTFTILGLTAHAYGLCASAAAFVLLGGMAILARRRRMPAGLTGLFGHSAGHRLRAGVVLRIPPVRFLGNL